jgi:hypothetical protein
MNDNERSVRGHHDPGDGSSVICDGNGDRAMPYPISFESVERYGEELSVLFDSTAMSPTVAIACAVAELAEKDPLDVGPVSSSVDTSALDAILRSHHTRNNDVRVHFTVDGYDVDVTSYGRISVRPAAVEPSQ